ncbi:MAG: DUF4349 domain-containing protein [Clostridiales bacterium]|nr:DUF4349 domain-containing protein [Clostridiales bacterium]
MKDEQRTERIMDWLEGRLSAEDSEAFATEREKDASLAEESALMSDLISSLRDLDADVLPSAAFHQSLMARLSLEEDSERKPVNDMTEEQEGIRAAGLQDKRENEAKEVQRKGSGRKLLAFIGRRRGLLAVAACCLVVIVLFAGSGGMRSLQRSDFYSANSGGGSTTSGMPSASTPSPSVVAPAMPSPEMVLRDEYGYDTGMAMNSAADTYRLEKEADLPMAEAAPVWEEAEEDINGMQDAGTGGAFEQKIIRTGYINLEVDSFDEALTAIKTMTEAQGGYVTSESSYIVDGRERKAGQIQVKVPYSRYDMLAGQAETLGKVLDSSSYAEDVTAQYIDLMARIGVYETKYTRLLALLEQSGELETILSIEKELAVTNAELESIKGQMRYLQSRTDYSTLDISLTEKMIESVVVRLTGFPGFVSDVKSAFNMGTNSMIRSISNLILWLVYHLATIVVIGLLFLICWTLWRRRRGKRGKAKKQNPDPIG